MNPKASAAPAEQKRSPPRRACKECSACLAPPCKECSNCLNPKFKKKCKRKLCPYLGQPAPSSTSAAHLSARGPSTSTGVSAAGDASPSQQLSSYSPDVTVPPDSQEDYSGEVVINKSSILISKDGVSPTAGSSSQPEEQESRVRKRQRLQEEHLRLKAVYNNYVSAKKDSRGLAGWTYQCLKCEKYFGTRITCTRHASTCEKTFTGKRRAKNMRQVTCNICPFKATTESGLETHRREAHPEVSSQRPRCWTCGETFASAKNLKSHVLKVHKKVGLLSCETCDKKFTKKFNLIRHMNCHLRDQDEKERDRLRFGKSPQAAETLDERSSTPSDATAVPLSPQAGDPMPLCSTVTPPTSAHAARSVDILPGSLEEYEVGESSTATFKEQDVQGEVFDKGDNTVEVVINSSPGLDEGVDDPMGLSDPGLTVDDLSDVFHLRCREEELEEEEIADRRQAVEAGLAAGGLPLRLSQLSPWPHLRPSTSPPCQSSGTQGGLEQVISYDCVLA